MIVEEMESITPRYSLETLEVLICRDIARLNELLDRVQAFSDGDVREVTADSYRQMIASREMLLTQIQTQSNNFRNEAKSSYLSCV